MASLGTRHKCEISSDGSYIDLTSPDGYDIVIDASDLPNQTRATYNTTLDALLGLLLVQILLYLEIIAFKMETLLE